jgi:CBS domain-containing protein
MSIREESEKKAKNLMSRGLVTVAHKAKIADAYGTMQARQIRHLPVTDEAGAIVGILSDRDVSRAMIVAPDNLAVGAAPPQFDPRHLVEQFMSWPVRAVSRESTVQAVTRLMLAEKISAVLVEEHRVPVGILTTEDLLKYLLKLLEKEPGAIGLGFSGIDLQPIVFEV